MSKPTWLKQKFSSIFLQTGATPCRTDNIQVHTALSSLDTLPVLLAHEEQLLATAGMFNTKKKSDLKSIC